ncbi:O-antigen polymerase [Zoogloea dura]|uniref:Oligosaccharide repeat unit polymerase n=1 Tax=Zoogloea dura TaxID=2728840 RepID=A0A848GC20_9RHOO|nr:O-antigen polymerase [Zoogloea dura]NML29119.1 oligosaccharide repeat unit polymerase [Zoogloea dura]
MLLPFIVFRPKDPFQPEFILNAYFILVVALGPLVVAAFFPDLFEHGVYGYAMYLIAIGYLGINFGFLVGRSFLKRGQSLRSLNHPLSSPSAQKVLVKIFLGIGFLGGAIFFARAGQIPIMAENKEIARVDALSVSGNGYFLYLMTLLMVGVAFKAVSVYSSPYRNERYEASAERFLFLVALIVGVFLTGSGSRRYAIWTILYVLIVRHYCVSRLSFRSVLMVAVVAFSAVNLFEMFRNPFSDTTVDFTTTSLFRFVIYASNFEKVLSSFVNSDIHYFGSTFFMDVLTMLPGKQMDYQSWLKEQAGLEFEGFGIPPTIIGDFFINFGEVGVVLLCAVYGCLVRVLYSKCIVNKVYGSGSLVVYVLLLEVSMKVLTSGLSAQMMSAIWIFSVLVFSYFFSLSIFRKRRSG